MLRRQSHGGTSNENNHHRIGDLSRYQHGLWPDTEQYVHQVRSKHLNRGIDTKALAGSARASKLIGSSVYNGDTSIGQIADVMVTLDQATVTGIVLSVGGFLGVGDKLVAVPVNQIRVGPEARFITDLTKDQLANAPALDFASLE
jgi:sporulation protein YlmC with PRC-barrel domain